MPTFIPKTYQASALKTGGGKTFLAAKSAALVNNRLLHTEHSVILWLVPSKANRQKFQLRNLL